MQQLVARLRVIPPERFVLALLVVVALAAWITVAATWPKPLAVTVFAVGNGNAVLVQAPGGRAVLYDGGSRRDDDVGDRVLVPNLLLRGVRHLDAVIVSHPDSDHINGLADVFDDVKVDTVLESGSFCDTREYAQLQDALRSRHIPSQTVRAGDRLNIGDGVTLSVLAPGSRLLAGTESDTNNNSVVCRLDYGTSRLLLTGDSEDPEERQLLAANADVRAQVLLVAHHGSARSTSRTFLAAVHPTFAVISTDARAQRGLPARDTLDRLRGARVRTFRTDNDGQITLTTRGDAHWHVETYRK
jgi:competence protein ComEC